MFKFVYKKYCMKLRNNQIGIYDVPKENYFNYNRDNLLIKLTIDYSLILKIN